MRVAKPVDKSQRQRRDGKTVADHDIAQTIALEGLSFLAGDEPRLERFLALSGLTRATLRASAAAPGFLLAVLDHIAGDEALLVEFSAACGRHPQDIATARRLLGGPPPGQGE